MFPFSKQAILTYAGKYDHDTSGTYDATIENECKLLLEKQDYLTRDNFIKIGKWKSKRPTKHYESNSDDLIREVSHIAFKTKNEELKIKLLMIIKGCSYPLASVILHFKFPNHYPIIDFRALWSLRNMEQSNIKYSFDFWWQYVKEIQTLSNQYEVSLRQLDKALWQYSKENQTG